MPKEISTAPWLQVRPQHQWHDEAFIEGNATALRKLAAALMLAADKGAATTETFFASDGEGYEIEVRRIERPDDFPEPFYIVTSQRNSDAP